MVEQRDTLWRIADKSLGDPRRWQEIYALNSHRVQPDGTHLTEAAVLHVGWTLLLPDDAPPADGGAQDIGTAGNRPGRRCPRRYLDRDCRRASRGVCPLSGDLPSQPDRRQPDGAALHDPDVIRPGWILTLPGPTAAPPAAGPVGPGPLSPDPPRRRRRRASPRVSLRRPQIPGRRPDPPIPREPGHPPSAGDHHRDLTTGARDRRDRGADPLVGIRHHGRSGTDNQLNARSDEHAGRTGRDSRTVGAASAEAPDLAPWAAGATVSGLAAAGLITALALNRRRQHRHRPAGHRIRVPATAAGRFEWTTGQAAATADAAFLDLALRCLALPTPQPPHVGDSDAPTSGVAGIEVAAVWLHPDRLQLDLAAPRPAHAPFSQAPTPVELGTIPSWLLAADTPLPISAEKAFALPAPFPLLATVATVSSPPDRTGASAATSDAAPPISWSMTPSARRR